MAVYDASGAFLLLFEVYLPISKVKMILGIVNNLRWSTKLLHHSVRMECFTSSAVLLVAANVLIALLLGAIST